MAISPRTPVIVGVGQIVDRWDGGDVRNAPNPALLATRAAKAALEDSAAFDQLRAAIDVVAVVRTNADSAEKPNAPFGRCANPPASIAQGVGASPTRMIYSTVGGDQPQALVNEFCEAIFAGTHEAVLLTGAEATAAAKLATRRRLTLDWSDSAQGEMEDRGLGKPLLSGYEIRNGLSYPTQTYPLFENALRHRLGNSPSKHVSVMSELWARFSQVAEQNPYAQFPKALTPEYLETESDDNYRISDLYLKWHVAQDAVNQGAALVLTSFEMAERLGVPGSKRVYLHGYAQASDKFVLERDDLSRSRAMEQVLARALASANKTKNDIAYFDLYSCFPCAVLIAAEILDLDWRTTIPTVTGGLPFFGGPGNNYSTHAIASMVERLRAAPRTHGLVLANGGFLSKEAAGVYSATAPDDWSPVSSADIQATIDASPSPSLLLESAVLPVETFAVSYRGGAPHRGYVVERQEGRRLLARGRTGHSATLAALAAADPIGKAIVVENEGATNFIVADDRLGLAAPSVLQRRPLFVSVARNGHVLEVTLNRPEALNALHSAAHFELHEIWDAFERDADLWVAIITGAGDRAFCSGNDLKASSRAGNRATPSSGFGGLCSRFDREKPIIAAVNGVAMGGGLEIVLSCDLAVADPRAHFALPEVRVGLFAAAGGVQRLTRQIGRKIAMDMILTGRHIDANKAFDLGIVNAVTEAGGALDAARGFADEILANSPTAIRASKRALNKLDELEALSKALEANEPIIDQLIRTKDFREGIRAFAEKRRPQWTNS